MFWLFGELIIKEENNYYGKSLTVEGFVRLIAFLSIGYLNALIVSLTFNLIKVKRNDQLEQCKRRIKRKWQFLDHKQYKF